MTKSRLGMLVLCLMLAGADARAGSAFEARGASDIEAEDFEGNGFWSALACAGCAATGFLIVSGGWGAILAAASIRGSTLAFGGCIAACVDAF